MAIASPSRVLKARSGEGAALPLSDVSSAQIRTSTLAGKSHAIRSARRLVNIDVRQDALPASVLLLPDIRVATDAGASVLQLVRVLRVNECDVAEAPDLHVVHGKGLHARCERRLSEVCKRHGAIVV